MIAESLTPKPGIRENNRGQSGHQLQLFDVVIKRAEATRFELRASPSNRVTTTVSPVIQLDQQPRQLLAVRPCAADLFLKDPLATGRLKFRHLRRQRLALLTRA
jgi:hypothetical protein